MSSSWEQQQQRINWKQRFPPLEWAQNYSWQLLKNDLVAGITVGVVVIPQGIAYATLAELPPVYGLYAALVPLPIYALLGSSRHISVGPFALVSILVAETVSPVVHCDEDMRMHCDAYRNAVMLLSLMIGILHLLMAVLRLDVVLVAFLSEPVLSGFTTASSILIAASQMKHMLGLPIPRGTLLSKFEFAYEHSDDINPVAFAVGIGGIMMLHYSKIWNQKLCPKVTLPEQLLLLLIAGGACAYLIPEDAGESASWQHPTSGISQRGWWGAAHAPRLVGHVHAGLPTPALPHFWDLELVARMVQPTLVVGLFSYILSMSIVRTFAIKFDYRSDGNQELLAFGAANIVGSCFLAYPAAGSLSRSALIVTICGGPECTPLHGLFTSLVVLVALVALTPAFRSLPYAVLASIVAMAVKPLFDFRTPQRLLHLNRSDFVLWCVAFGSTLLYGVQLGIGVSVGCSLVTLIASSMRPPHGLLGRLPGTSIFVQSRRRNGDGGGGDAPKQAEGVAIFGFTAALHFANKDYYRDALFSAVERRGSEDVLERSRLESLRQQGHLQSFSDVVAQAQRQSSGGGSPEMSRNAIAAGAPSTCSSGDRGGPSSQPYVSQAADGSELEGVLAPPAVRGSSLEDEGEGEGGATASTPASAQAAYSPVTPGLLTGGSDFSRTGFGRPPVRQPVSCDRRSSSDGMLERLAEHDEEAGGNGGAAGEGCDRILVVVLDFAGIPSIDASALRMLEDVAKELKSRDVRLLVCGVDGQAKGLLLRAKFFELIGPENVFARVDAAAKAASAYVARLMNSRAAGAPEAISSSERWSAISPHPYVPSQLWARSGLIRNTSSEVLGANQPPGKSPTGNRELV